MLEITLCRRLDDAGFDTMTECLLAEEEGGERLFIQLVYLARPTVASYITWISRGVPTLVELDVGLPPEGGFARLRSMRAPGSASSLVAALGEAIATPAAQLPLAHGFHGGGGWLFQAAWEAVGRPGVELHPFTRRRSGV